MRKLTDLKAKIKIPKIDWITGGLKKYFKRGLKDRDIYLRILALTPLIIGTVYLNYVYATLSPTIPLWHTKLWGGSVLAPRINVYLIPLFSALFTLATLLLSYLSKKLYFTFLSQILLMSAFIFNLSALLNIVRISYIASREPLAILKVNPQYQMLIFLILTGFLTSVFIIPKFIAWAFKKSLVTDPSQHKHPGMILKKPSARGGGFIFSIIFAFLTIIFVEKTALVIGVVVSAIISGVIGLLDDYQNTHPNSRLRFIENPGIRLFVFLPIPVIIMMAFGIVSGYINNPFDGGLVLTQFNFNLAGNSITPLPYLFTFIWTIAIMNLISWSNGVDGQFGGVAGISILIIGILALRLQESEPSQINTIKMAFLAAGICFGFIPHTWNPSKIMWGFGAVTIGIMLSSLSIVSRAKVATSILVIMIPFLDGIITFFRRVLAKKNPLKGDRGHLHHLLLERGWSPKKVAVFYWIATAFFGIIGLLSAEKSSALVTLTLGGIVASVIIFLNLNSRNDRHKKGSKAPIKDTNPLQQLV